MYIERLKSYIVDGVCVTNLFVTYRGPPGDATTTSTPVMIIGANNVFEVDCSSEALKIGDNNVLEAKCLYNQCFVFERKTFT
jgi:hypothetical protein